MSRNILAVIIGIVFSIIFLELTIKFCAIMGIGPIGEEIIAIKKCLLKIILKLMVLT